MTKVKPTKVVEKADALGQMTSIGDKVAYIHSGYKELREGVIEGFTPKGFRIKEAKSTWRHNMVRPADYVVRLGLRNPPPINSM